MSVIYDQIKQLTRTERLDLVHEIWDGLAEETDQFELTQAQAAELDRRLNQHRLDPSSGSTLDELAARLGERL